ncbi:2'-5' RNA ligase family protein [Actinoplanes sp. CA-252034]|uniref:2'-5' RNA ligase family protein n=1 Tax=Actinoplanes sp. CA-252034 TaxID=3239906 RepID=UPI003D9927A2
MRTVELVLDDTLDATVRDLWRMLHVAGLRSLATHTHPSNRPHITLAVAASLETLPPVRLPVPVRLGPVRMLGRALVRDADSPRLRELQAEVWRALDAENPLHTPDVWAPHVSLALNMPETQRAGALALLTGIPAISGEAVGVRSYDTETRTVTDQGDFPAVRGRGRPPTATQIP